MAHGPLSADEITAAFLSECLRAPVASFKSERIGAAESFSGADLNRFFVTCVGNAPNVTLVAKGAPCDAGLRHRFQAANAREIAFYTASRADPRMPVPVCLHAAQDPLSGRSLLVLAERSGDMSACFTTGLNRVQVDAVVDRLARFHAETREPSASSDPGSAPRERFALPLLQDFDVPGTVARYRTCLTEILPDRASDPQVSHLIENLTYYVRNFEQGSVKSGFLSQIHGDLHSDNILIGPGDVRFIDWQLTARGPAMVDLAYLLISSLAIDDRRAWMSALVERYHARLTAHGVRDVSLALCKRELLIGALYKLFATLVATVWFDARDPARRNWRAVDLDRLLAFCADHDL